MVLAAFAVGELARLVLPEELMKSQPLGGTELQELVESAFAVANSRENKTFGNWNQGALAFYA